jgi:hypothetical protein
MIQERLNPSILWHIHQHKPDASDIDEIARESVDEYAGRRPSHALMIKQSG